MTLTHGTNRKLGEGVWATTLPIKATCPTTCLHHPSNAGTCYAWQGHMRFTQDRWEREGKGTDPTTQEPALMRQIPIGALTRLHVAGDFVGRRHLAACERTAKRRGLRAWAYTHAWRTLRPSNTSQLSLLASCDTHDEMVTAHYQGFPVARIVSHHQTDKAYALHSPDGKESGFTGIPCPAETKGVTCETCKLCLRGEWLHESKRVILFTPHGSRKGKLKELIQIEKGN